MYTICVYTISVWTQVYVHNKCMFKISVWTHLVCVHSKIMYTIDFVYGV